MWFEDPREERRWLAALPALHKAVRAGDAGKVRRLLATGSDPNRRDDLGRTPLAWAVAEGESEICRMLLDGVPRADRGKGGARKREVTSNESDAREEESQRDCESNDVRAPGEDDAPDDAVDQATADLGGIPKADPDLVVPIEPDLDVRQSSQTPFILAARLDRPEMCKLLQSRGTDPFTVTSSHYPDHDHLTALHWSVCRGDKCIAQMLYMGLDINNADNPGRDTPLHCASAWGPREAVERLVEDGAFIEIRNIAGQTPAMAAQTRGRNHIVDLLVQHGAQHPDPPTPPRSPQSTPGSGCSLIPLVCVGALALVAGWMLCHIG